MALENLNLAAESQQLSLETGLVAVARRDHAQHDAYHRIQPRPMRLGAQALAPRACHGVRRDFLYPQASDKAWPDLILSHVPFCLSTDGLELHYDTVGTGPSLILQTGGAGDGSMWRDAGYLDALSSHYECVLFDHRGHGRSSQPRQVSAHRMETYVDDVVALLDHRAQMRTAFWGYSQGAEVGLALAAMHPERVTALITTGVVSNPDRRADKEETLHAMTKLREGGWNAFLDSAEIDQIPSWFQRQIESTNPEMLALWMEAWVGWDPWERLSHVTAPALMFVGEQEDPHDWNSRAGRLMRDARVVRLLGLDHLAAYIHADLVLPTAIEFLSRVHGPATVGFK